MPLQTRNVFIDTQSFVKAGLDFTSSTLQSFKDICDRGGLNHITTTVTVDEVNRKISESMKEALAGVSSFRRKAKLLVESKDAVIKGLFEPFDSAQIVEHALQVFKDYLEDANTTIVDLSKVDPNHIFDLYFKARPPFHQGKKSEFPDAFTLLAIDAHLQYHHDSIYIVSEDTDLKMYCETNAQFIHVESLLKVVDLYNSHDNERATFLKKLIASKTEEIKKAIETEVEEADAYNVSWPDSVVDELSVISVGDFEPAIVTIDDESCVMSFEVEVHYGLTVSGPDTINGVYNREADHLFVLNTRTQEEGGTVYLTVEIQLYYEVDKGDFKHLDLSVSIPDLRSGFEVRVEEDVYPGYR